MILIADMPSAAVSCVVGVFCSYMGDAYSKKVVEDRYGGHHLECNWKPCFCRPEFKDYHTLRFLLFNLVDAVADDTEWGGMHRN